MRGSDGLVGASDYAGQSQGCESGIDASTKADDGKKSKMYVLSKKKADVKIRKSGCSSLTQGMNRGYG